MEELCKLDSSLRTLLLSEDRFLFCDETTEQVKVVNRSIGKMEYRKKYIWGIKNPILRLPISFMTTVAVVVKWPNASLGFTGSVTTDSYNVYKLFERKDSSITRYACMTHVRRKFVEVLQNDDRFSEIVNLISELYWVNRITRFVSYQKRSDDSVRFRYLARFGNELNLYLMRLAIMPQLCF